MYLQKLQKVIRCPRANGLFGIPKFVNEQAEKILFLLGFVTE